MADLKVDADALQASVTTLGQLRSEFDDIENRRDETGNIWGHGSVRDAMHEFASNMDYNRGKLSEQIAEVGAKVESTLQTFSEMEDELARSFDQESGGGS